LNNLLLTYSSCLLGCDKRRISRLLLSQLPKKIRKPFLRNVSVRLDTIHQGRLAQVIPSAFDKRELHIVLSTILTLQDIGSQSADVLGHIH
jgi:hypothetical protein